MNKFLSFMEDASTASPIILTGFIIINNSFLLMHVIYYYIIIGILLLLDGAFKAVYNRSQEVVKKNFLKYFMIINFSTIILLSILEFVNIKYGLL